MMSWAFHNLLFIFFLCFSCFLAGWLTAVYILPGNLSQRVSQTLKTDLQSVDKEDSLNPREKKRLEEKSEEKELKKTTAPLSFLKEMMDNLKVLFDPYKMDSVLKENTHLKENNRSYIKNKTQTQIPLKTPHQAVLKSQSKEKSSQDLNKQGKSLGPLLLESNTLEPPPTAEKSQEMEDLKKLQLAYDEKNKEQLLQILKDQKFFSLEGKFSFLINVFSERDKALDYIKDMKDKYPLWSFLIKVHKDHVRIYLGPFQSRERALEFKAQIPPPSPFSLDFLEEVSL